MNRWFPLNRLLGTLLPPTKKKFSDARSVGTLDNRYTVFLSEKMPRSKILVGLLGEGFEIESRTVSHENGRDVPEIDVVLTKDPLFYKGELAYWGFINVLDMGML